MRLNTVAPDDVKDRIAVIQNPQIQALITSRPAQIENWVDANCATLAGVRVAIKLILKMLVILARRELREP